MNLFNIDKHAWWNVDEFQINCKRNVLLHRTAHECHFAATLHCSFNHLLHAVNVAGETCGDNAAVTMFVEQLTQHCAHASFAWRMAVFFCIGGVTHQQANAHCCRQFTETRKICAAIINWSEIKLEVTGVHNHTLWCVHDDGVSMGHRVGNRQELNIKWPNV